MRRHGRLPTDIPWKQYIRPLLPPVPVRARGSFAAAKRGAMESCKASGTGHTDQLSRWWYNWG